MKKLVVLLSVISFMALSFTGCEWAGPGADKMEKGIKKMEDDFNKSYEEEKKK